jgi:chromosomal replication initiator protein
MVDAFVPDPKAALTTRDALRSLLVFLDSRVRREQLETWFRSLDVVRIEDSEIELSVTSQFVRDWLVKNYMALLQDAARSLGEEKRRIVLTQRDEDGWDSLRFYQPTPLSEEIDEFLRTSSPVPTAAVAAPAVPSHSHYGHTPVRRRPGTLLNPNYTFDRFVVGSCNRLAHASALAIGENPGHAYNPLFVHGNVGLGKSHLLQAICHTVLKRDPNARVLYMSCEDFANAFIHALQTKTADSFRDYYRHADVLVIDDVQFLAHKEKCQEEFFHTFNTLYDDQRQIVLSSDRRPAEIPTIEGRIESRFHWGLVPRSRPRASRPARPSCGARRRGAAWSCPRTSRCCSPNA